MRANALLIKYPHGYLQFSSLPRIAAEGRYEAYIETPIEYRQQIRGMATTLLDDLSEPWTTVAGYQPLSLDDEPYRGFTVGDTITFPDHTGALVSQRVVAVSVTIDENGEPIFVPELGVGAPTPPVIATTSASDPDASFKRQSQGQFGAGGGQGFEGGTGAAASGRFSGAYGSGATRTDALTGMAQGGEITFSADGRVADLQSG